MACFVFFFRQKKSPQIVVSEVTSLLIYFCNLFYQKSCRQRSYVSRCRQFYVISGIVAKLPVYSRR